MSSVFNPSRLRLGGERGFTFSELALVVVFVAGLLLVVTTSVRGIRRETADSNCQTQLRTLKLATEQYHLKNQAYPNDASVLVDSGLVKASEISDWVVKLPPAASEPTFEPDPGGPCG